MTQRVLLNSSGLKVSKPGYNVTTATDDSQLSFDTKKSMMIWHSVVLVYPGTAGSTYSFPALGFRPCYTFQLYANNQWMQGYNASIFPGIVYDMSSNSCAINWLPTADGFSIQYIRLCIYNIRGE